MSFLVRLNICNEEAASNTECGECKDSYEHLPFATISITLFLFTVLPPVLLLVLYPFQMFRSLLFKCLPKRLRGPLNIFVEKFYSCYRDGLDGGRDMRSLAGLYFFVLLLGYILFSINGTLLTKSKAGSVIDWMVTVGEESVMFTLCILCGISG